MYTWKQLKEDINNLTDEQLERYVTIMTTDRDYFTVESFIPEVGELRNYESDYFPDVAREETIIVIE